jgi:hypothetical protein
MLRREAGIDRRVDPDRLGSEQQRKHLGAVDGDDRHGVPAAHAQPGQHGRRPVYVEGELGERPDEGRVKALGVRQHRDGRAIGPQLGRPRDELMRAGRKSAPAERDALDFSQVRWTAERGPEKRGCQHAHAVTNSVSGAR